MGYTDLVSSYSNQKKIIEPPDSGGGLSQNQKFSYGYASSAGKRPSMEDFFDTRIDGVDGQIVGLFGVFDGHGGTRAAEYVKHHLFSNLITHPKFISDTKSAIADAYNHTDSELLKLENSSTRDAGSTASTAILVGDRLLVANVGDSRAVMCRSGNAIAVSRDHKPDQSDERERIENAGGFVMWAGTWRVGGVLAVSRAFGDRLLKQYVVADPEIREEKIDDSLEFLILASDGLWDVFSNEEAVAVVKDVEDPEESTKKLVGEAIERGSADNITCVVVRFLESKTANIKASQISSTHTSSSQAVNQEKMAIKKDSDHKILAKEVHSDLSRKVDDENLKKKSIASRSGDLDHISSSQDANRGKLDVKKNYDHKIPAKEVHSDLSRKVENENLNQKPIAARSDDSGGISLTHAANQGTMAIKKASDHKISAKEVHNDLSHKVESENLNQKPIGGRSVDSGRNSSSQKANRGKLSVRNDSDHKISTKETNRDHTTVHNDIEPNAEKLTLKLIAARSSDSGRISSSQEANRGKLLVRNDSDHKISAKETNRDQTTMHNDLDPNAELTLKLIAARSGDSSRINSSHEVNRRKLPVKNDLDHKILAKETNRDHTKMHSDLDSNVELTLKLIAARSGDTGRANSSHEANRGKLPVRNDLGHKILAKETNRDHKTMHNNLDPNAELTLKLIAARSGDSERTISSQDANRGKLPVRNDLGHKISAKETNRDHTTMHNDLDPNAENLTLKLIAARSGDTEHNRSSQDANRGKRSVRNGSDHKNSAKETNRDNTTMHNDLDPNAENLTLKLIAARNGDTGRISSETKRNSSSDQSGLAGEKNKMGVTNSSDSASKSSAKQPGGQKTNHITFSNKSGSKDKKNKKSTAVHGDSGTSKASRVFNPFSH